MSLGFENKCFTAQLFKQRELRSFEASDEELTIAKESLILKKKCNTNVHSLLFCKTFTDSFANFSSQNQKKILEDEKSKYFDYVRKTFKEKIPEDFESENKLKKALKTKIRELKEQQNKDETFTATKRLRPQTENAKQGTKKSKTQKKDTTQKPQVNKKEKQQNKQKKEIIGEEASQAIEVDADNVSDSFDLNNGDLDEQDYDGEYNDE